MQLSCATHRARIGTVRPTDSSLEHRICRPPTYRAGLLVLVMVLVLVRVLVLVLVLVLILVLVLLWVFLLQSLSRNGHSFSHAE